MACNGAVLHRAEGSGHNTQGGELKADNLASALFPEFGSEPPLAICDWLSVETTESRPSGNQSGPVADSDM